MKMKPRFLTLVGMIATAGLARLMPHPWNVTPVAAMALFGGVYFDDKRAAFAVPILAMVLGDIFLVFNPLFLLVYACFAATVIIGFWVKKNPGVGRIAEGSIVSSVLFFVVTNAGMWVESPLYAKTPAGLVNCYVMALPYFRNTLFGDLAYTALLFGAFQLATRTFPVLRDAS